jgi:hypothetical protein
VEEIHLEGLYWAQNWWAKCSLPIILLLNEVRQN